MKLKQLLTGFLLLTIIKSSKCTEYAELYLQEHKKLSHSPKTQRRKQNLSSTLVEQMGHQKFFTIIEKSEFKKEIESSPDLSITKKNIGYHALTSINPTPINDERATNPPCLPSQNKLLPFKKNSIIYHSKSLDTINLDDEEEKEPENNEIYNNQTLKSLGIFGHRNKIRRKPLKHTSFNNEIHNYSINAFITVDPEKAWHQMPLLNNKVFITYFMEYPQYEVHDSASMYARQHETIANTLLVQYLQKITDKLKLLPNLSPDNHNESLNKIGLVQALTQKEEAYLNKSLTFQYISAYYNLFLPNVLITLQKSQDNHYNQENNLAKAIYAYAMNNSSTNNSSFLQNTCTNMFNTLLGIGLFCEQNTDEVVESKIKYALPFVAFHNYLELLSRENYKEMLNKTLDYHKNIKSKAPQIVQGIKGLLKCAEILLKKATIAETAKSNYFIANEFRDVARYFLVIPYHLHDAECEDLFKRYTAISDLLGFGSNNQVFY